MRALLIGLPILFAATPATAQAPQGDTSRPIVVTGVRVQDFRNRLAACLARHCPTNEDADATLALAEALFINGDYAEGRTVVRASLDRNRGQARAFPEPVSDLWRANARLDRHIGLDREARTSTFEILRALQAGLPSEDYRHFTARFEIAENQMYSANFLGARRALADLARSARAADREDVAVLAELRDASYELVAFPHSDARARLLRWSQSSDPAERMRMIGASLILARLLRAEGQTARSDALLAQVGAVARAGAHRRLLFQPTYQLFQSDPNAGTEGMSQEELMMFGNTLNRVTENYEDKWIDVGFWINPDGHVSDLEVVRRGAADDWAQPLLQSIGGRIYNAGVEPTYRLERYTMTANFELTTGSRIQHRGPGARAEYLDLTANTPPEAPADAAPARPQQRAPGTSP